MNISELRHQAEQFRTVLELEKFDLSQDQRDLSGQSQLAANFAHVSSRESLDLVETSIQRAIKDKDSEEERSLRQLRAWLIQAFIDHEVRNIDQEILIKARNSTITTPDGQEHRLQDARLLLATTNDAVSRQTLDDARSEAASSLVPLLAERLSICHGIARSFNKESFLTLWADAVSADVPAITSLAEAVLDETQEMYEEVMGWTVRKRLGVALEDAHRRDLPFIFAGRYTEYTESYTVQDMVSTAREFLSRMGIQLPCEGRLSIVINKTRVLPHRAFVCAPRIPTDIRIVLQAADGQRDLARFLSALGRGLFAANIHNQTRFEDRILGDGALDLTYGRVFKNLLLDRTWLKRTLNVTRPKDYLILAYLERLYDLRLVCARVLYEFELYKGYSIDHMRERFNQIFRRAISVQTPNDLFLHEVRRPFLSTFQLRARLFEALYTGHLKHYFNNDWWQNPAAGPFLKKEWSAGRKLNVEQRCKDMGYDGLTVAPLKKLFMKNL
ncbi:MAG: hypothetical protein P1V97_20130 [Planctomycetota bacterium]|nr:hypothetical protein [Planctomycetota bacterium]